MKKRILVMIIIFSMLLTFVPARGVQGEETEGITLRLENDDFKFYEDAKMLEDGSVQLTDLAYWQNGGIWYEKPVTA